MREREGNEAPQSESEAARDWPSLLPDLILLITNRLPDVTDFTRFRAVCKGWRSSAPISDPPPQLPWLLERDLGVGDAPAELTEKLRFYSLATEKTGTIRVKEPHLGIRYHGPCNGYLLLLSVSEHRICMWNPLTNADISFSFLRPFVWSLWPIWMGLGPILRRDVVFVGRIRQSHHLHECWAYHPGNENKKWNFMEEFFYNSCCYWEGKIFTTKGGRDTGVFDATSKKLLYNIPSPELPDNRSMPEDTDDRWPQCYLVEISGVIMRVCMYLYWTQKLEDSHFDFYELHFEGRDRKPSWVKVSDIRNHMLFLDVKNGFSMKPNAGLKGNCIYFLTHLRKTPWRYDIPTGTFQRVPCPFKSCTWFLPSLC